MALSPQLPSESCLALATDLDLPAGYSIRTATNAADYVVFSKLARAYHKEPPVDLGFQAIDKELASLPGCYSSPAGIILLLSHQPHPDQPPEDVGCVALRPLSTNTPAAQQAAAGHTDVTLDNTLTLNPDVLPGTADPAADPDATGSSHHNDCTSPSAATAAAAASAPAPASKAPAAAYPSNPPACLNSDQTPHLGSTCELKRLWVSGDHSGGGEALAAAAVAAARCCGYKHIVLETLERLAAANKVYEGLGFVQRGPYYNTPLRDVVYYQMEL